MLYELLFDDQSRCWDLGATMQLTNLRMKYSIRISFTMLVMSAKRESKCIHFIPLEGGKETVRKQVHLYVVVVIYSYAHLYEYEARNKLKIVPFGINMKM